jgi:ribosomal protein S12 methylthiotransferase RimO
MAQNRVALVTLGCARNDVDSDELAARLLADGWEVVTDADDADAVIVNTCGFVEAAKKDSIDTVLENADGQRPVIAVGCLAQRYGSELAAALPEANAVLGFDQYPRISEQLAAVMAGEKIPAHQPSDRRKLLPITPVSRQAASPALPGHGSRTRLNSGPVESVKIASGCDRRCSFCAIPTFRGSFVSRRPYDIIEEVADLLIDGVREINLVSENSTSYGKDLGQIRLLEELLPELGGLHPDIRVRVAYLQPAEMRPDLVSIIANTPGVAPYFDLSFQHASPTVLRRMRRFGGRDEFLELVETIRHFAPEAGIRTNVIVGFPGETEQDFEVLCDFIENARLDAVGVFPYSDEDGTEALTMPDKVSPDVIEERRARLVTLVEDVTYVRALERVGTAVRVLIEEIDENGNGVGRAAHQGPEDSDVLVNSARRLSIGDTIHARVTEASGVDLIAVEV